MLMLPENGIRQGKKKYHYYITDDEVRALLGYADRCSPKWKLLVHMALFAGLRANELCWVNIADFPGWKNLDFSKLSIRVCKTGDEEERPINTHLQEMLREYVILYDGRFPGGYLFPSHWQSRYKRPVIGTETIGAWFAGVRKRIKKTCPGFDELFPTGKYRIHWHVLRHWFQTRITRIEKDPYFLRQLMSYRSIDSVLSYVRVEDYKARAARVMEDGFKDVFKNLELYGPGQTTINQF